MGNAYFELKMFQEALESYRNATQLQSNYCKAYYCAAECYLILGDVEGALGELTLLSYIDEEMANELLTKIFPGQKGSIVGPNK